MKKDVVKLKLIQSAIVEIASTSNNREMNWMFHDS